MSASKEAERAALAENLSVNIIPAEAAVKLSYSASSANNGHFFKKMMTNLPKRPPALIDYLDLEYTVYERLECYFLFLFFKLYSVVLKVLG